MQFIEFMRRKQGSPMLAGPSETESVRLSAAVVANAVSAELTASDLQGDKRTDLSNEVAKLVTGDKFLNELSALIREPMPYESEEAFVKRCGKAMEQLLEKYLGSSEQAEKIINP